MDYQYVFCRKYLLLCGEADFHIHFEFQSNPKIERSKTKTKDNPVDNSYLNSNLNQNQKTNNLIEKKNIDGGLCVSFHGISDLNLYKYFSSPFPLLLILLIWKCVEGPETKWMNKKSKEKHKNFNDVPAIALTRL